MNEQVLPAFFQYLIHEKRYSQHTIAAYKRDLNQFSTYIQESFAIDMSEAESIHIRSAIVHWVETGLSNRSVNRKLSSIKSYFRFAFKRGFVSNDSSSSITGLKQESRLPDFIPLSEISTLFENAHWAEGFGGTRDKLILLLLYTCGLRRQELIDLKPADIDLSNEVIKVKGKGGKERMVPFLPQVRDHMAIYQKELFDRDSKCPNLIVTDKLKKTYPKFIQKVTNNYLSVIKSLKKRSPHVLRHTYATHLADEGADLNAIKTLLGHSSLAATQVYTHTSINKLKSVHKNKHPKG